MGIGSIRPYHVVIEGEGLSGMSHPETDTAFKQRLICLVSDELRPFVRIATGSELDAIGRKYDRYRIGAPLKRLDTKRT